MSNRDQTRFAIELHALDSRDIPATYRLRRLVKYTLRACGLRYEDCFILPTYKNIRVGGVCATVVDNAASGSISNGE
mgnify:CR=1 FL=1